MERWLNKLIALVVIMLVMITVVFIPFKIMACFTRLGRQGQKILARLNCFTGGIFLGTCLLFLLPEVSLLLSPSTIHPPPSSNSSTLSDHHTHQHTYPYAQLVILIGFLIIMYIERSVHACRQKGQKRHVRSLSVIGGSDFFKISFKAEEDEEEDEDDDYDEKYKIMPRKDENNNNNNEENNRKNNEKSNDDEVKDNGGVKEPYKDVQKALKAFKKQVSVEIEDQVQDKRLRERGESEMIDHVGLDEENTTKAVILFIALAMDEVLGGLSMGLQRSNAGVWGMVVGLLAHEAVVGFSFGLQLAALAQRKRLLAICLAFFYAIMTPIGAALGLIISEFTVIEHIDIINGVLQGMATGVFLYVTFFEILEGEIHSQTPLLNIACFTIGCIVMAIIAALPKDTSSGNLGQNLLEANSTEIVGGVVQKVSDLVH